MKPSRAALPRALDAYLGTGMDLKVKTLDQLPIKEHLAAIPPLSYIVPFIHRLRSMHDDPGMRHRSCLPLH
jgi:hypothetical protein